MEKPNCLSDVTLASPSVPVSSELNPMNGSNGGGDIFQKINALLDNNKKMDFGKFMPPSTLAEALPRSSSSTSSSLSPTSSVFYPSTYPGSPSYNNPSQTLSSLLGLPSHDSNGNIVRQFAQAEVKFPDVSSPLNKILSRNGPRGGNETDPAVFGINGFGSVGSPGGTEFRNLRLSSTSLSSPGFEGRLPSKKFDLHRSGSPASDDGYGTSYGSALSSGGIRRSPDDRETLEILRRLNLNGSPTYSRQHDRLWSNEVDPNVAHAVRNLQALQQQQHHSATVLQNLHNLNHYMNGSLGNGLIPPCLSNNGYGGMDYSNQMVPKESLERAAKIHRNGTAINDASCTWSGQLPSRNMRTSAFSCKVFLGGVPWDITETALANAFKTYGNVKIEWPGKDNTMIPKGYLYVIFENEKQVRALLNNCTQDYGNGSGSWYFKISSRRMRNKEVQIIPWVVTDSNYVRAPSERLDPQKTVFVGALHGMLTAEGLANIFNDLFGNVVYAGIDTDKYKYPMGSGRVTFSTHRSYLKAVSAAFIEIKTAKFNKKVQVDPYLEDALCSSCGLRQGPYFCREADCFKYFCRSCWGLVHATDNLCNHKPLMRNSKNTPAANRTAAIASALLRPEQQQPSINNNFD